MFLKSSFKTLGHIVSTWGVQKATILKLQKIEVEHQIRTKYIISNVYPTFPLYYRIY